jgi:hypothetical protein
MTDDTVSNQKRLPDPKLCRILWVDQFLDLSKCLVEDPDACEYGVRFGFSIYCYHPDRYRFEKAGPP